MLNQGQIWILFIPVIKDNIKHTVRKNMYFIKTVFFEVNK